MGREPYAFGYSRDHREQLRIHATHGHAPKRHHFWQPTHLHERNGFGGFGVEYHCGCTCMGLGGMGLARVVGVPLTLQREAHCHFEWTQSESVGHP